MTDRTAPTTDRPGRLAGEIALVTGSTAGIGRAVARRFAAEGATVAVTGRRTASGAALVGELRARGSLAGFHPADLAHEGDCSDLVDWVVEEFGGLTVLVHTVTLGTVGDAAVHDLSSVDWDQVLRLDVSAAMWLSRAAIGAMLDAEHGSIVNIASSAAAPDAHRHAAVVAANGALRALSRSIAADYAADRIRCNSISPACIADDDEPHPSTTPTGSALDVANAALFLASSESAFVTGIDLPVDGGSSIAGPASVG